MIQPRVLDLNEVVAGVEQLLQRTLGEHVELTITAASDLRPVLADPGQLKQVLVNLAVNARDAMPAQQRLSIETRKPRSMAATRRDARTSPRLVRRAEGQRHRDRHPSGGHRARLRAVLHHQAQRPGNWPGLATVYGIVTQAGGALRIYSEPGLGTVLDVLLPVTDQASVAEPDPPSLPRDRPDRADRRG